GSNVVIISNALWRRRLNADSAIVGRQIRLDDRLYTVLGVMPAGFSSVMSPTADLWSLWQYDPSLPADGREWGHHLRMVGRLRVGVDIDQASGDLEAIAHTPVPEFARPRHASMERGLPMTSLQSDIVSGVRPA